MSGHSMQSSIAGQLVDRFRGFTYENLPDASLIALKRLLLDYLGVAIAGANSESGAIAREFALLDGGHEQASLIGDARGATAAQAAFANAISAHSLELDDIDVLAYFHFSPPVYSAALAAAELEKKDGRQLLVALAAGCELMERVSRATNPSLRDRSYHTTSTCGVFGATISAGLLWGLTPVEMVSALGLAGAQAAGVLEFQGTSMQKRFGPGPAARAGLTAARLAQLGFIGQELIFEGKRGFIAAFSDQSDSSQLTNDLHQPYPLLIEFKPYACARPIHNAIDCALEIRRAHRPNLAAIERIEVARHPSWAGKHGEKAPRSFHAAQLSLAFSTAVALKDGQALLEQYSDANLNDPLLQQITQRTYIVVDETLPRGVSCRITMSMDDGRLFTAQVDYPKGSIEVPMSDSELSAKFIGLTAGLIGADRAAAIVSKVSAIEHCTDVRELMRLTRPRADRPASTARGNEERK
jgi:2-methylcitrate dehydratase PrpD